MENTYSFEQHLIDLNQSVIHMVSVPMSDYNFLWDKYWQTYAKKMREYDKSRTCIT